ncbi:hypothetical protein, partial [Vibrio cholerae]
HGRIFGQKPLGTITTAKSGGLGMTITMPLDERHSFICACLLICTCLLSVFGGEVALLNPRYA